jgi:hypothetical protein
MGRSAEPHDWASNISTLAAMPAITCKHEKERHKNAACIAKGCRSCCSSGHVDGVILQVESQQNLLYSPPRKNGTSQVSGKLERVLGLRTHLHCAAPWGVYRGLTSHSSGLARLETLL